MQTALIFSLSATYGLIGVTMVNPVAVLPGCPSWDTPKHPR